MFFKFKLTKKEKKSKTQKEKSIAFTFETKSDNSSTTKPCNLFQSIFKLIKFLSKK